MRDACMMEAVQLAGRIILENGGETYRVEDTVQRMGKAFGCQKVEVFAVPSGVFITLVSPEGEEHSSVKRTRKGSVNLEKVNDANQVSRAVAAGEITPPQALEMLREIEGRDSQEAKRWQPLAAAFSSGAFAVVFAGGFVDFVVAFFCAFFVQWLIRLLDSLRMYQVAATLIGAGVSTLIPLVFYGLTGLGTVNTMVAGALMPLLPGLAMANAVQDTMRGDLISGVVHAASAILTSALIAGGALAAQYLYQAAGGVL